MGFGENWEKGHRRPECAWFAQGVCCRGTGKVRSRSVFMRVRSEPLGVISRVGQLLGGEGQVHSGRVPLEGSTRLCGSRVQ